MYHFLIATDGSYLADYCFDYVGRMYGEVPGVKITVIHVSEKVSAAFCGGVMTAKAMSQSMKKAEEDEKNIARESERILERSKSLLEHSGFESGNIETVTLKKGQSVSSTLVKYATKGLFDAVLAGRRGLGHVMSYFIGSVSYNMLQTVNKIPVWFLEKPIDSRRVLVAIDNCEQCMRVADHAAYVFRNVKDVEITLLHVVHGLIPGLHKSSEISLDDYKNFNNELAEDALRDIIPGVKDIFQSNGFDMKRVNVVVEKCSSSVASELVAEYKKGGYGTIVMGRRGISGWEAMFPGSVSDRLTHSEIQGCLAIVC